MAEFDDKLNAILSNPDLMGQIMSMAGAMNQTPPPQSAPGPGIDPGLLQNAMTLMRHTQIDPKQQNLLRALRGFLPDDRLEKLEKAMQAARIAKFASASFVKSRSDR